MLRRNRYRDSQWTIVSVTLECMEWLDWKVYVSSSHLWFKAS